jgi:biopolymer transport protein ExbD
VALRPAAGSRLGGRARLAEINVTPLVDVMLVLLIISLVAAPMLQRSIHLDLPETTTATEIDEARVVVSLDREAKIRINDTPVHPELLADRMRALAAARPDETVYLQAHKNLAYGEVLHVMDAIRSGGISRVALVTQPVEEPAGR